MPFVSANYNMHQINAAQVLGSNVINYVAVMRILSARDSLKSY